MPPQNRRQLIGCIRGALAHTGHKPQIITGIIRHLLMHHFQPLNIDNLDLLKPESPLIWQEGERTGIVIESVNRWTGSFADKRPAILLKRNAYQNLRVMLSDRTGYDEQGNDHFTTLWVGSHTVFCIHGSGASADLLATEVQQELTQFGIVVVERLGLAKFLVLEVGEVSELAEATQNMVVPVTVGWAYQESWKLAPEALPLTAVDITINVEDI